MVKVRHARREPYNLILVDWKMPGMDGVETTRQIRLISGTESAIIILTAYNWDDIIEEAVSAGVDSFIAKPLFASNVVEEFRLAFEKKKDSGEVKKADLKGKRILLAEDMEVNAEIMGMVLNMREMEVEYAKNGKEALDLFSSHEEGYFDAILMDMNMPEMDGLESTTKIRALERNDAKSIPIIALTANAFDEDVQRSLQAGMNAHLSKPVEPDILFETL
ncbi:MAG: response regulator [Lachnospiraceae bacterium]|nr:response regulator [Lachnospiraceae bacterium]